MGVGEPKLPAKHTVEKHYHPPLRGFGRVAAAGSFPGTDRLCRFRDHLEEPSFSPVPPLGNNSDETGPWRCEASPLAVSWYFGRSQCSTVCILLMKQFLPECHLQFFSISAFPCSEFWSLLGPCRFVHKIPDIRSQKPRPWLCP